MTKAKGKAKARVKLKTKGSPSDLLKTINKKSKKKWSMGDIKSLAKNFSKKDLKNDKKLSELIKKVSKAVGVQLSDQQMSSVKKQVHDRLG
ncbi:stage VI sporulation protein F [Brevibacillus sp. 179-C9.3 HS]|uniref:stage VI sporulation protein F n=1 Tax=unclassified Brevibacillus TaxID=2684853 RepID=UPI00399F2192